METIAKDGKGEWCYDDGVYWFMVNGVKSGKIYERDIPDPMRLWESKAISANVAMGTQEASKFKPNDVIFKLWEHKNA